MTIFNINKFAIIEKLTLLLLQVSFPKPSTFIGGTCKFSMNSIVCWETDISEKQILNDFPQAVSPITFLLYTRIFVT